MAEIKFFRTETREKLILTVQVDWPGAFVQIDKGRILQETLARLAKLEEGQGVLLQPYKKDRSVCIVLRKNEYQVFERGFDIKVFAVETGKIRKVLKRLCRKEFPRSNKIWLKLCTSEEIDVLQFNNSNNIY